MVETNQASEAINILSTVEDETFNGLILEVKGDALVKLNEINGAREAYRIALEAFPERMMLRIKLNDLSTKPLNDNQHKKGGGMKKFVFFTFNCFFFAVNSMLKNNCR